MQNSQLPNYQELGLSEPQYNNVHDPENTMTTVKHVGERIMLWRCSSSTGTGKLIRIDGKLHGDDIPRCSSVQET